MAEISIRVTEKGDIPLILRFINRLTGAVFREMGK